MRQAESEAGDKILPGRDSGRRRAINRMGFVARTDLRQPVAQHKGDHWLSMACSARSLIMQFDIFAAGRRAQGFAIPIAKIRFQNGGAAARHAGRLRIEKEGFFVGLRRGWGASGFNWPPARKPLRSSAINADWATE